MSVVVNQPKRFETKEKASIEIYGQNGTVIAHLRNLSNSGACIEWEVDGMPLVKGDLVRMTVNLNILRKKHLVNAEVMWSAGKKGGVQFIDSGQLIEKMLVKGL